MALGQLEGPNIDMRRTKSSVTSMTFMQRWASTAAIRRVMRTIAFAVIEPAYRSFLRGAPAQADRPIRPARIKRIHPQ